jgi:hypothetical protein
LMYWSEDKVGNVESVHYAQVNLDKTLPEMTLEVNGASFVPGVAILDNQVLVLSILDQVSGLQLQQVALDGALISPNSENGSYQIYLPGQLGMHQLQVYAKDLAGNQLSTQVDFTVTTSLESLLALFIECVNSGDLPSKLADKLSRILQKIAHVVAQAETASGMNDSRIILQLLTHMAHELDKNASAIDASALEILQNDIEGLIRIYQAQVAGN